MFQRPNGQGGVSRAKMAGAAMALTGLFNLGKGIFGDGGVGVEDFESILTGAGIIFLRDGMR